MRSDPLPLLMVGGGGCNSFPDLVSSSNHGGTFGLYLAIFLPNFAWDTKITCSVRQTCKICVKPTCSVFIIMDPVVKERQLWHSFLLILKGSRVASGSLASRGILGAQSNNYWQKTERVSLRRKEEEKYLQIVAEPAISVERSEWSAEW